MNGEIFGVKIAHILTRERRSSRREDEKTSWIQLITEMG